MSFKTRVFEYCMIECGEDCPGCILKPACEKISTADNPKDFTDEEFAAMEDELLKYMKEMTAKLNRLAGFMLTVSEDRMKEFETGCPVNIETPPRDQFAEIGPLPPGVHEQNPHVSTFYQSLDAFKKKQS